MQLSYDGSNQRSETLNFRCVQFSGEILKPNYNSVDMVEVELVDDHSIEEPRQNSSDIFLVLLSVNKIS